MQAPVVAAPPLDARQLKRLSKALCSILRYPPVGGRGVKITVCSLRGHLHHDYTSEQIWQLLNNDQQSHRPRFVLSTEVEPNSGWITNFISAV